MSVKISELEQIFFTGNQLLQRWQGQNSFAILASDFGDGSLFLRTWQLWQQDNQRSQRLHYLVFAQVADIHAALASSIAVELLSLKSELLAQWPEASNGFHRLYLQNSQVMLTLIFGEPSKVLTEVTGPIDAFFLDKTADWALPQFKQLRRLCKTDSTLISNSMASSSIPSGSIPSSSIPSSSIANKSIVLAKHLDDAGFSSRIELNSSNLPYLIAHCLRAPKSNQPIPKSQHAIIIGAGLAGCAMAASLASRNWKITLIDAQASIASQASGNHIGLCHPMLSLDDNFQSRLSRAGFATTKQKFAALLAAHQPIHFACDGHFQMAKNATTAQLMQSILLVQSPPAALVQWFSHAECQRRLNIDCEFGGWWFPQGMWANPKSICNGYITEGIDSIDLQLNTHVNSIQYADQHWHVYDSNQHLIARSETLILANANDAQRLLPDLASVLSASLRSASKVNARQIQTTPHSISGLTYLSAEFEGWRCAGASLVNEADISIAEANNLKDLANLIGQAAISPALDIETRLCYRPNSADRLPLVGALADTSDIGHAVHQLFHIPRINGLYGVLGFGSRGLTWHALAAEVLACQLNAEPQGIERSLLNAIDPARFALRQLRKKTSKHTRPDS